MKTDIDIIAEINANGGKLKGNTILKDSKPPETNINNIRLKPLAKLLISLFIVSIVYMILKFSGCLELIKK